jgi:3-deoxy-D-manno-octulosonate 8-phosphate phosphatase (KDO 8-P phosphatase)
MVEQAIPPALLEKASAIELLALDVDGVLTNGTLYFSDNGEAMKGFSIRDGLGIKLLQRAGVRVAIITGRESGIVTRRASELGIETVLQNREDKLIALNEMRGRFNLSLTQCAYMGDDLPDLPAIAACGLGTSVANGYPLVQQHADWVSPAVGGAGAVRQLADLILQAKGLYTSSMARYLPEST